MCNKRLGLAITKKKKNLYQAKEQTLPAEVQNYRAKEEFRLWALGGSESKISILGWPFH